MVDALPQIVIYDTLTAAKKPLAPLEPGRVSMYVCGLTVYDYSHIGHARTFILFDVIRRYITHRGYEVRFVRNHTDVDDRIIRRANEVDEDPLRLAERFINALDEDLGRLRLLEPDVSPRVTEEIPAIIEMVEQLIAKGHAYEVDGDVFFEVGTFSEYGKLSKKVLDDLRAGERVDVDDRKRHPGDFALWKSMKPGEPHWDSPWGQGRPGWHIECSAMSSKYLGATFDIHGGGRDLVFPHHENEIAQSECASGATFANHWMHAGPLKVDGEKMGKSLGNFWTVRDALKVYHPDVIRYFMLTSHYRKSINYSEEAIKEARAKMIYFLKTGLRLEKLIQLSDDPGDAEPRNEAVLARFWDDVHAAMDDDFNTSKVLAAMHELAKLANDLMPAKDKAIKDPALLQTLKVACDQLRDVTKMLGLILKSPEETLLAIRDLRVAQQGLDPDEIEGLIADRVAARDAKDWGLADEIRDKLQEKGIVLMDGAAGTTWEIA